MAPGANDARHPGRHRYGPEVADVIKSYHPANLIGAGAYVALHVGEEHIDGEAVGNFDGGNHAYGQEDGQSAPVRHVRQYAAEEALLFEFPGFWGTASYIAHCTSSPSASVNSRFHVHTGPQHEIQVLVWLHQDFHGNALHYFYEIAGSVLWREQRLQRATRTGNGVNHTFELLAVSVHVKANSLAGRHILHLRFLEICRDVDLVERDDGEQQLSRRHVLPKVHGLLRDLTRDRGGDVRVSEIQLGLLQCGLGALDRGERRFISCFGDRNLLLLGFRLPELRLRA